MKIEERGEIFEDTARTIFKKVKKDISNQEGILSKELIINTKNVPLPLTENNGIKLFEVNKIQLIGGIKK